MEKSAATLADQRPTLKTQRLILRPFRLEDAKTVQRLAGVREITLRTGTIPYPYPDGLAETWIQAHAADFAQGKGLRLAMTLQNTNELIGCVAIEGLNSKSSKAELGYWVALDYWNKGYCSEAAAEIVKYAFKNFDLNKITSRHKAMSPASGAVMKKIGMKFEGCLRQEMFSDGEYHDLEVYGLLRSEFSP